MDENNEKVTDEIVPAEECGEEESKPASLFINVEDSVSSDTGLS
jgi:hypothetical protein